MNEGILDSILPYLAGYKKPTRTTSDYVPIIKKNSMADVTKPDSFSGIYLSLLMSIVHHTEIFNV